VFSLDGIADYFDRLTPYLGSVSTVRVARVNKRKKKGKEEDKKEEEGKEK
jgi:hypothetical protein